MNRLLLALFIILVLGACGNKGGDTSKPKEPEVNEGLEVEEKEPIEIEEQEEHAEIEETEGVSYEDLTSEEKILYNIIELLDDGKAFDSGSYIPGDIPEGEYVFSKFDGSGEYYSEKELNGDIIDNENFSSFGYVYVHGIGNVETQGVLINVNDLEEVGATGAKEIYEALNGTSNYKDSGYYKVGIDIEPGEYVIESINSGYVAVMSGPVGSSDIVNNENFDGRFAVNVQEGQYLKISGGMISE